MSGFGHWALIFSFLAGVIFGYVFGWWHRGEEEEGEL